jgi:hypothetical protein
MYIAERLLAQVPKLAIAAFNEGKHVNLVTRERRLVRAVNL